MSIGQILLDLILGIINTIVTLITTGLISLINPLIPSSLNDILTAIGGYFGVVGDYLSFALSYLGFYSSVVSWAIVLIISIIMVPFTIHNVKLLIRWWFAVKP